MEEIITHGGFADGFTMLLHQLIGQPGKELEYTPEMSLEERINVKLAGRKERFKPTRSNISLFCDTIGDKNPLHRSDEYARFLGFEKGRIVPGTQINANLDQFVEEATSILNSSLKPRELSFHFAGNTIDFSTPIYPGEQIRWQITGYKVEDGNITLYIPGANKRREIIIDPVRANLSREYPQSSKIENPKIFTRDFTFRITEESLADYKKATGDNDKSETIPWSYSTALVTSALLEISTGEDGAPTGINRGMKFQFHKRPTFGDIDISVFLIREPKYLRKINQYKFSFGALCHQDNNPVLYGNIDVVSDKKIN